MAVYTELLTVTTGGGGVLAAVNAPVTVYQTGTTTKVTLYTDATLSTTTPNPVTANSAGVVTFFCSAQTVDLSYVVNGVTYTVTKAQVSLDLATANANYVGVYKPEQYASFAAMISAINTAGYGRIYLTPGVTYTSAVNLNCTASDVHIDARGAVLALTDDGSSNGVNLQFTGGSRISIDGLRITQTAAGRTGVYGLLFLSGCTDVAVTDLHTIGGSSTGVFTINCSRVRIVRPVVENTKADGIQLSRGTVNSLVDSPVVLGAQDDGVAVVSVYQDSGGPVYGPCRGIQIRNPVVRNSTVLGSGVSLVGAQDCSVTGGFVDTVPASAVYIAQANYGGVINPARNTVSGLVGTNCASTSGAVRVANADDTALVGLALSSNPVGVVIVSSSRTRVLGSRVASTSASQYGVYDDTGSSRTVVSGCVLDGNTSGAFLLQGTGSTATADNITA